MYELSRVRLKSVGPAGARFHDVLLDLSGAGRPVAYEQGSVFRYTAPTLRPAPAALILLENGGGKSVLLKLIFSVLLPGRRHIVGTKNTRIFGNFVMSKDVSHIVLEWMDTRTGRLLLTGKAMGWQHQVASGAVGELQERWYCLRPNDGLTLDALPFAIDNQSLLLQSYKEDLHEAWAADQSLELSWFRNQGEWTTRLEQLGIDPELFRYQREMNVDEGEAVGALKLDSDAKFIDFFIKVVVRAVDLNPLATLVADQVQRLANRGTLITQRDFVRGALTLLEPVVSSADELDATTRVRNETEAEFHRFLRQVMARARNERKQLAGHQERLQETRESLEQAVAEVERSESLKAELNRLLAQMQLDAARERAAACAAELDSAQESVQAWAAVPVVEEYEESIGEVERLTALINATEEEARPALKARDDASKKFARALWADADRAAQEEARERALAAEHAARSEKARQTALAETRAAAVASGEAAQARKHIEETQTKIAAAVADGLLPGSGALPRRLAEVREELGATSSRIDALEQERSLLEEQESEAQTHLRDAQQEAAVLKQASETLQMQFDEAMRLPRELERHTRVTELLESEPVELDRSADDLLAQLASSLGKMERETTALSVEEHTDKQARLALAAGELLPPPAIVTEACSTLEEAGIRAVPGWKHLADLPASEQRGLVERAPHLAAGILLNDPSDMPRARSVLEVLRPQPTFYVSVASTRALHDSGEPTVGMAAALPLHPALYDEEAAQDEHDEIEARHARRIGRLQTLDHRRQTELDLHHRVAHWRRAYPAGAVAALETSCAEAVREQVEADKAVTERTRALEVTQERRTRLRKELPPLRETAQHLVALERVLADLALQQGRVPEWEEQATAAETNAATQQAAAEEAEERAGRLQETASQHVRDADELQRTIRLLNDERDRLPGSENVRQSDPVPELALSLLRTGYHRAAEIHQRVAVGSKLMEDKRRAEERAGKAKSPYGALDERPRVRDRARELLGSPQGSDAGARAAAQDSASRELAAKQQAKERALIDEGLCKEALDRATSQLKSPVEVTNRPHDIAVCQDAAERAEELCLAAVRKCSQQREEHEEADRHFTESKKAEEEFRFVVEGFQGDLSESPSASEIVEPYGGDATTARDTVTELRGKVSSTEQARRSHESALQAAVAELQQHATAREFKDLHIPVQSQIRAVGWQTAAAEARGWVKALRPRMRSLDEDIEQIERHRNLIIENLRDHVVKALNTLRLAQRLSRLPDSLDGWAGEEFLRFAFNQATRDQFPQLLGEVIDAAAAGQTPDGRTVKRDGMSLLLNGVRAVVPKGFRVEVLKPDPVLRKERVRVCDIKDTISGGQQLTTAILLYCTMAALRANNRGRVQDSRGGVLFLDNPIGRANAEYLLELQRKVAEALGVQLLYTTGLSDDSTLKRFPLVLRLRNDADLRTGRKYLTVAERLQEELDALEEPDGEGRITATRIYRTGTEDREDEDNGEAQGS